MYFGSHTQYGISFLTGAFTFLTMQVGGWGNPNQDKKYIF